MKSCTCYWLQGFAYVTFASPEALQKALALHGTELHGHELKIAPASQEVPEIARTAFVLDLPASASEDGLRELFALCGNILSMRLPLDRNSAEPRVSLHPHPGLPPPSPQHGWWLTNTEKWLRLVSVFILYWLHQQGRTLMPMPVRRAM